MALRVGVVGGGQLARMMIAPAVELGVELRVLAEEEAMSASLAAVAVGDYRDAETVLAFARDVDVVTFDHEHVPQEVLAALVDAGVAVRPGPDALQFAQDKLVMRARLAELGMPQPDWAAVTDAAAAAGVPRRPRRARRREDAARRLRRQGRARRRAPPPRRTTGSRPSPRTRAAARCSSRSSSTSRASSRSRSPAGRPARCACTTSSRPCSAAACAPR